MSGVPAKAARSQGKNKTSSNFFGGEADRVAAPFFSAAGPRLQRKCANCEAENEGLMQPKLTVGEPNDRFEQEADRVADEVVQRQPVEFGDDDDASSELTVPLTGKYSESEQKKLPLQRRAKDSTALSEVPPIVHEVLSSSGQPLEPGIRGDMESRFGYDFAVMRMPDSKEQVQQLCPSCEVEDAAQPKLKVADSPNHDIQNDTDTPALRGGGAPLPDFEKRFFEPRFGSDFRNVRIHTDQKAAEAARDINAQAFTLGQDIGFASGHYAPGTDHGRRLLAHELTHVLQQKSKIYSPKIQRRVSWHFYCAANSHSAPPNPRAALTNHDRRAGEMCETAMLATQLEAILAPLGIRGQARAAYERRFGLPVVNQHGQFVDRLSGRIYPTMGGALSRELNLLALRLGSLRRVFTQQNIIYYCIGQGGRYLGVNIPHCSAYAWTVPHFGVIWLCPLYWQWQPNNIDAHAIFLVHEANHLVYTRVGDAPFNAENASFFNADCYARYVADIVGATGVIPPGSCPEQVV